VSYCYELTAINANGQSGPILRYDKVDIPNAVRSLSTEDILKTLTESALRLYLLLRME